MLREKATPKSLRSFQTEQRAVVRSVGTNSKIVAPNCGRDGRYLRKRPSYLSSKRLGHGGTISLKNYPVGRIRPAKNVITGRLVVEKTELVAYRERIEYLVGTVSFMFKDY